MNRIAILVIFIALTLTGVEAGARNTIHQLSIADFMAKPENANKLKGVVFYFGNQPHPNIVKNFGEYRTNKKTNAFNKKDEAACDWVMLSAMLALHQRALSLGANAVINIKSNYKDNEVSSTTKYTCGAGAIMAGVALIGTFVTLEGAITEEATASISGMALEY
jgi:uncharacterized protein YbjQ (UPF0145 family)